MDTIANFFKVEEDPIYRRGYKAGKLKAKLRAKSKAKLKAKFKAKLKIASKLKKIGVAIADIAKGTGISIDEIQKL